MHGFMKSAHIALAGITVLSSRGISECQRYPKICDAAGRQVGVPPLRDFCVTRLRLR
jgi:hypothetical protein